MQSAAYITGEKLYESRRDLNVNYENRHSDIVHTHTLIPEGVPSEFKNLDVWDKLESFEDTYAIKRFPNNLEARVIYMCSAQTAMTIVMALPKELSTEAHMELVEEFAHTRFVSRGLVTTVAIHDDEGNAHAHLQIARRSVNEQGEISFAKDREICTRKELLATRKLWADLANQYLEREGFDVRITEKSFADLGIDLEPTKHRGWYADQLNEQDRPSRIVLENTQVFHDNKERVLQNPEIILNEITATQATFNQKTLLKAIQKRVGDDAALVASIFETALDKALVVGEGVDGQSRYTSASYKDLEDQACAKVESLLEPQSPKERTAMLSPLAVDTLLHTHYEFLSPEQHDAVKGLTQNDRLSVLIGRAGSGKTTTLRAVAEAYKEAGYQVVGTSLSALAAENLGSEASIKASTLHSLLYQWNRLTQAQDKFLFFENIMEEGAFKQLDWYKDLKRFEGAKLHEKSVVIVDEAGMIGTRGWAELLDHVQKAGAKVIAVGDDHQFKAIEAGDFFRELKNKAREVGNLFNLETIRRQHESWMREASHNLANLEIQQALSLYEQRGHILETDKDHMGQDIAQSYVERVISGKNGLVLAFTNAQTQEINGKIREHLKDKGMLERETILTLKEKDFSLGETLVFLKNEKHHVSILNEKGERLFKEFIKNGTRGTLESVTEKGEAIVRLNKHQRAVFDPQTYDAMDYGYAVTTHKSQGQTVDFTVIAASKHMDAKGVYVAMTRHRSDVQLYYAREDFASFKHFTGHLSRFEVKDLVKDYTIRPENEAAFQRVQEYRNCILDAAAVLKEAQREEGVDWKAYQGIKKDQIELGKDILSDFSRHKLYLEQAGMTGEMLEITVGTKPRPLSLSEENAKLTVEMYGETARLARLLWKDVRGKDPAIHKEKHEQFQELREDRDSLARVILQNYPLHWPFMQGLSKDYGITKKILENQVAYRDRRDKEVVKEAETHTKRNHQGVAKQITLDPMAEKTSKPARLVPSQVEKIDHIMKENRLHQTFGPLHKKDYGTIGQVMEAFKNLAHAAHEEGSENGIMTRATFMVCYLKDQIHHTNLTPEQTHKLALMASKQFADQRILGDFESNNNAHFKAKGALRREEKSLEKKHLAPQGSTEKSVAQSLASLHKEDSHSRSLIKAENHLHTLIHRINNECRAAYNAQQHEREHERELRFIKDKGLER